MNRKNNIKMSTLDHLMPKYYKGYDMDILIRKIFNKEPVTEEEKKIVGEAQNIYYEKHFKENRRKAEEWMKAHPGEYTKSVHPQKLTDGEI